MNDLGEITVLDGVLDVEEPALILDSKTARKALALGELDTIVRQALDAQSLSGKLVVLVKEETG